MLILVKNVISQACGRLLGRTTETIPGKGPAFRKFQDFFVCEKSLRPGLHLDLNPLLIHVHG